MIARLRDVGLRSLADGRMTKVASTAGMPRTFSENSIGIAASLWYDGNVNAANRTVKLAVVGAKGGWHVYATG